MAKKIKKDFDKDKMYRKIMPSVQAALDSNPAIPPLPEPPAEPEPEDAKLHNYMEDMVLEKIAHTSKVLDACPCERCRRDILALALNQLPTAYAVADGDGARHLKKLRGAYEVKATAALIKAIQQVKQNPRH